MLKKIIFIFFGIAFLFILLIIGLFIFINPNEYKKNIEDLIRSKTGYELTLEGDFNWHLWTKFSLVTDHITVRTPNETEPFIQADQLRLDLDLLPLFSKKIEFNSIVLDGATVDLISFKKYKKDQSTQNDLNQKTKQANVITNADNDSSVDPKKWAFLS